MGSNPVNAGYRTRRGRLALGVAAATVLVVGTGIAVPTRVAAVTALTFNKAFGTPSFPLNGTTSLTFTINNPDIAAQTGIGFADTLPAGLIISTPNGLTGPCGGGTITATQGTGSVTLSGATLAANTGCSFGVNVTGTSAGNKPNTTTAITSNEGGGGAIASANVTVVGSPPSLGASFSPPGVAPNGVTTLNFTITNPGSNTVDLTGVAFSATLPTGLTVANSSTGACGGTLTTTSPTGIGLSGATVAHGSSCGFGVSVTGTTVGNYAVTTFPVTSTNGGTGNTASASLVVSGAVFITKAFGAPSISLNAPGNTTSLTFTITNPQSASASGIAFTDNLPAGLVVANPNNISNTCGGSVSAINGAGTVSLAGGSLAATASCAVSVTVTTATGATAGDKLNTVQVSSTEGGLGNTASATISVLQLPALAKAFAAQAIPLNGVTSLTFTVTNPNAASVPSGFNGVLTAVAFTDTLPPGLLVATPNGLTNTCGGTPTATQGTNSISLSGGTAAASSFCTMVVNVTGTVLEFVTNTTSPVTSTNGGTGNVASAPLTVGTPTGLAMAFRGVRIEVGGSADLLLTITNPNTVPNPITFNNVGFVATLPGGLVLATPQLVKNTCPGGIVTAIPGAKTASMTGATLLALASCTVTLHVTGTAVGLQLATATASSNEGGPSFPAMASITVTAGGYWLVASDGGIFPFGNATGYGSLGGVAVGVPTVGMAANPAGTGYWLLTADGDVFSFGSALDWGTLVGQPLNQRVVGIASGPLGHGYWIVAADGGVFPFGEVTGHGSTGGMHLNQPIVGMASTKTGLGYWLVAADGGIFPFGDAVGYGSTGGMHLNQPIVGMARTFTGQGYWLVAADGGIFPFGDASGHGSTGNIHLNQPIVGMSISPTGDGYWLVAADGGIFPFGDAIGDGSTGGIHLNSPIVGMASTSR